MMFFRYEIERGQGASNSLAFLHTFMTQLNAVHFVHQHLGALGLKNNRRIPEVLRFEPGMNAISVQCLNGAYLPGLPWEWP